jgi:predicted O-methyltransferase YrrM
MELKDKLTDFLNNGISTWTGEKNVRYPTIGNIVFLEILECYRDLLDYSGIETFFEAGTFNGNNAVDFSNVFDKVITVENDHKKYHETVETHGHNEKITFLLGDGTGKLREHLTENPDERMVILLDDHNSYNAFIAAELKTIRDLSNVDHIIIIDDTDKLGMGTYPTREQINEILASWKHKIQLIDDTERHKMLIFKPRNQ